MEKKDYAHVLLQHMTISEDGGVYSIKLRFSLDHEGGKLFLRKALSYKHDGSDYHLSEEDWSWTDLEFEVIKPVGNSRTTAWGYK